MWLARIGCKDVTVDGVEINLAGKYVLCRWVVPLAVVACCIAWPSYPPRSCYSSSAVLQAETSGRVEQSRGRASEAARVDHGLPTAVVGAGMVGPYLPAGPVWAH